MKMWLILSNLVTLLLSVLIFFVILSSTGAVNLGLLIIAGTAIVNTVLASKGK
ncbi:MAG: hypothetical protein NUV65_05645 [Candidatus Roizmanbacteria bacterium]|nr:hypothetical protein [Candidatus Roizmanbacteria bacterium]